MTANYHTHTPRCFHATGTEEEYIQNAIAAGLEVLGFSDHAPQPFKNGYYSKMRMYPETLPEYAQSVLAMQKKYSGLLQIHLGLEAEYYPALFSEFLQMVRDVGTEYLILGQHWPGNEQGERHMIKPFEDETSLARYCDQVIEAMHTGAFTYVAHPDLPNFIGENAVYARHMRRMICQAKACDVPLEINLLGARTQRNYPDLRFWELVAEENCPVVLGQDAHSPDVLLDKETPRRMLDMVEQLGLPLLSRVALKKP